MSQTTEEIFKSSIEIKDPKTATISIMVVKCTVSEFNKISKHTCVCKTAGEFNDDHKDEISTQNMF